MSVSLNILSEYLYILLEIKNLHWQFSLSEIDDLLDDWMTCCTYLFCKALFIC